MLTVHEVGVAEIWDMTTGGNVGEPRLGFRTRWCVSDDARTLTIGTTQAVHRFDLETGAPCGTHAPPVPRCEGLLVPQLARAIELHASAVVWRMPYGTYLHQSDGPRGWVQPLPLSPDGIVAVPARDGAAVLRVPGETAVLGTVRFTGKLRASRVVDGDVLLVNERGDLFRQPIPVQPRET